MNDFKMSDYNFYRDSEGTIIAVSSYGGKTIKGYAKCNPQDEYSQDIGELLAAVRCNEKIARKKVQNAAKKREQATNELTKAFAKQQKMDEYLADSNANWTQAFCSVAHVLNNI